MSATTTKPVLAVIVDSPPSRISLRWIISAADDLVWFIGSVLASYLLLVLYVSGLLPLVPMVAAWAILFDAPHLFGTFSRTYFDREERAARKRLLLGSLLLFVVGPVMVLTGVGALFFFLALGWAYYHLVKQHYGFMVLYKKKNNDLAVTDNVVDQVFLLLAFSCPLILFVAHDPEALRRVPGALAGVFERGASVLLVATVITTAVWLLRQIQRAVQRQPLNIPKYLLLAAAIPMHWVVLLTRMPHKLIAIVAILTIYHNLQYHRLVWFHNKKYTRDGNGKSRYGAAELISRRWFYYLAFGILFGLWYQLPRHYVNSTSGPGTRLAQTVSAFFWGYALIHYYLDSKIWRVRHDPSVGKALRME